MSPQFLRFSRVLQLLFMVGVALSMSGCSTNTLQIRGQVIQYASIQQKPGQPVSEPAESAHVRMWKLRADGHFDAACTTTRPDGSFELALVGSRNSAFVEVGKEGFITTIWTAAVSPANGLALYRTPRRQAELASLSIDEFVRTLLTADVERSSSTDREAMLDVAFLRGANSEESGVLDSALQRQWATIPDARWLALLMSFLATPSNIDFLLNVAPRPELVGGYGKEALIASALVHPDRAEHWSFLKSALEGAFGNDAQNAARMTLWLNGSPQSLALLAKQGEVCGPEEDAEGHRSYTRSNRHANGSNRHDGLVEAVLWACRAGLDGDPRTPARRFTAWINARSAKRAVVTCHYPDAFPVQVVRMTFWKVRGAWVLKGRYLWAKIVY